MRFEETLKVTLRHLARTGLPIVALDPTGRIAFWSEGAFDLEAHTVAGERLQDVLALEDARGRPLELAEGDHPSAPFVAFVGSGQNRRPVHCVPIRLPNESATVLTLIFFAAPDAAAHPLTRREVEVVRLLAAGVKTREIGEQLHISPTTVRNHIQNVLRKLDLHSRVEVVSWAHRHKLLNDGAGKDDENAS